MKGTLERVDGLLTGEYLLTIRTATNPGLRELVGKGVAFEGQERPGAAFTGCERLLLGISHKAC